MMDHVQSRNGRNVCQEMIVKKCLLRNVCQELFVNKYMPSLIYIEMQIRCIIDHNQPRNYPRNVFFTVCPELFENVSVKIYFLTVVERIIKKCFSGNVS